MLPNQPITRSYDINYLNLLREGSTDTRISSGQVTTDNNVSSGAGGTTTSSTSSTVNASQLLTTSRVDLWQELQDVVNMIIGSEPGNNVVINPQAGLLVVKASTADQQNVQAF
ncbi:type II and III secretion system protein, partial [Pseudomonas fluorescens]